MSEEKGKISRFGALPVGRLEGLGIRPRGTEGQGPQTVPGRMLASQVESVGAKYEQLKADVQKAKDSGLWVMTLDPKKVHSSRLADRIELSLAAADPELAKLKRSLQQEGQIQPISVLPIAGRSGEYEIVSGHRRHAAALQLDAELAGGFLVRAVLDGGAGDAAHRALRMYVENAARMDLSPYELALAFRRWLDDGLFPSQDAVAEATGLAKSSVSKYMALASLPDDLMQAFQDPRAISLRWLDQLAPVLREHRNAMLQVAGKLAADPAPRTAEETLRALLAVAGGKKPAKAVRTEKVTMGGRVLYKIAPRGNGIQIQFGAKLAPELAQQAQEKVKQVLSEFLSALPRDAKP